MKKSTASAKSPGKIAKPKVAVGKVLPSLKLPATGGKTVDLKSLRGKSVVLYFYPKDSTPGCTLEGRDFSRLYDAFKKAGAEVFGVSRDSLKSHENFKAKENYAIDLLSDADESSRKHLA